MSDIPSSGGEVSVKSLEMSPLLLEDEVDGAEPKRAMPQFYISNGQKKNVLSCERLP